MSIATPESARRTGSNIALATSVAVFAVSVVNCAWVCDDAFISFRTIDNFVNGYGLRWNVADRVQAFSHPLWLFLLILPYWAFGNIYYVVVGTSVILSVVTVYLVCRVFPNHWVKLVWTGIAFSLSKAYVEYGTSGLENPLTHLILAVFLLVYLHDGLKDPRKLTVLCLLVGFATLNRLDALLIVLPALSLEVWRNGFRRSRRPLLIGLAPLACWLAFSVFYYGTPLPNTAFAKLPVGVPKGTQIVQGLDYLVDSLIVDPLTLVVVVGAVLLTLIRRQSRSSALAVGIALHVLYILWVGGDFMSGRFLTSIFLTSVFLVSALFQGTVRQWGGLCVVTLGLGALSPASPLWVRPSDYATAPRKLAQGVVDERAHYVGDCGLFAVLENGGSVQHRWARDGRAIDKVRPHVAVRASTGLFGYYAGPKVHIVDTYTLSDPFLARLPVSGVDWRPGHFPRSLPRGYVESLWKGENRIVSSDMRDFYDVVTLTTQGDLLSLSRFKAILSLNLGLCDYLVRESQIRAQTYRELLGTRSFPLQSNSIASMDSLDTGDFIFHANRLLDQDSLAYGHAIWREAASRGKDVDRLWETGARIGQQLSETDQGLLAIQILRRCASGDSSDVSIHTRLAEAHFSQGQFTAAAFAARPGLDARPMQTKPLTIVADIMRIHRMPEAEENYRKILRIDPANTHAAEELLAIVSERPNPKVKLHDNRL